MIGNRVIASIFSTMLDDGLSWGRIKAKTQVGLPARLEVLRPPGFIQGE